MQFAWESLAVDKWQELKETYRLNEWGGAVDHCLRDLDNGTLLINQGGQNRREHPDEFALIYQNQVCLFDVYTELAGSDHSIRRMHIHMFSIPEELTGQEKILKDEIKAALMELNKKLNVGYLRLHPGSKIVKTAEVIFENMD